MTTFEITLLVTIIVFIFAISLLSVPSEKGKQMHEQAKREDIHERIVYLTNAVLEMHNKQKHEKVKREDIQERTTRTTNHTIKNHTREHSILLMHR